MVIYMVINCTQYATYILVIANVSIINYWFTMHYSHNITGVYNAAICIMFKFSTLFCHHISVSFLLNSEPLCNMYGSSIWVTLLL